MSSTVRQSMGLAADASISATFGDLSGVRAGSPYLHALSEILKRFPGHYHLFAGPGDVKPIRAHLHSEGVLPRVRFMGAMPDVGPLLDAADIYLALFPGEDPQALSLAAGASKPVVALQTGVAAYVDLASRLIREGISR